jgi:hypothetical protein
MKDEIMATCDCMSEILLMKLCKEDKQIYLSNYTISQFNYKKPSFWQRLKYCYYHLTTGKIYEDQLVFDFEKAKRFADWINEQVK